MKRKELIIKVVAETCRLLLGAVFVFSGIVKAVDPMGFEIKMGEYLSAWGIEGYEMTIALAAFNLIAIEFTIGVCLLLGVYRRYTSMMALALMAFMTPLTLYVAIFNPVTDCGCFGDAIVISNQATFFKNIVLLAAACFVYAKHDKLLSCFTTRTRWFVPLFAYFSCLSFAYWNYNHLPLIDFRPYKVGVNIPEQMAIPEGAPVDEYRYSFVYEKDGVKKTFSLEDYPQNDPSWTFVESHTELLKKGYTPPIAAFNIFDPEGNDVTDLILEHEGEVFLLIAAHIEDANDECAGNISNLYDYAERHGIPFYCVTGSSAEAAEDWIAHTGAEYPFLEADETLLKTIIRSNPGLVLIDNGTILRKWHYNDMPEEEDIIRLTSLSPEEEDTSRERQAGIYISLSAFTIPLLLVWIYDLALFRRRKNTPEKEAE
ncbi:MAG: DoxX family protein [Tannerellaceae bacterium]|jgi:uncharacterized membrane protein YphA (DoxX/SURF4 family)|nr:DoxX family protein [Tannerellaceae bacterium]